MDTMLSFFTSRSGSISGTSVQSEEEEKNKNEKPTLCYGRSEIEAFPSFIKKPSEQIRYENLSKYEHRMCNYLAEHYRAEIDQCAFWTQDIIPRFVTDTHYVRSKSKRLELTKIRFELYLKHHKDYHFDDILTLPALNTPQQMQIIEEDARLLPMYFYGIDKEGHPLFWNNGSTFGNADKLNQVFCHDNFERATYQRSRFKRMEANLLLKIGHHYSCQLSKCVYVLDLKHVSLSDFFTNRLLHSWNMKTTSKLFPETMHRAFVIHAPWSFKLIWKICCTMLSDDTVQKTLILGNDYMADLLKHIDKTMIPKEFGGHGLWEPRPANVPIDFPFQMNDFDEKADDDTEQRDKQPTKQEVCANKQEEPDDSETGT